MAIDISYYFKTALDKEASEVFDKYFGKYNYNSLYTASKFFSNLKEDDISWMKNTKDKEYILQNAPHVADKLKDEVVPLSELLQKEIYPRVDVSSLLSDLSPKVNAKNVVLECPCCEKKEAFVGGHGKGSVIICNRENKCGAKTTFVEHIQNRENIGFYDAVKYIADNAGVDLDTLRKNYEVQRGDVEDKNFLKEKIIHNKAPVIHDSYSEIEFEYLDSAKSYKEIDTKKYLDNFHEMNDKQKFQMVLSYIREFSFANKDAKKVLDFFASRGLAHEVFTRDVGFVGADMVPKLVKNLKDVFGEKTLIDLSVLSENGFWKHGTRDKATDKFSYCDAILFSMHTPYSDVPTNLEFRFIGEKSKNVSNKTSAIENSSLISPNYYGSDYKVESLLSKDIWFFHEGAIDAKSMGAMGYNTVSLIGVHKHFDSKLGYFKDKVAVIAFDQDNAGIKNVPKISEKLYRAGAKKIIVACWDEKYGKDINDLLMSSNIDKIKFSTLNRHEEIRGNFKEYIYTYSTNVQDIDAPSIEQRIEKLTQLSQNYLRNNEDLNSGNHPENNNNSEKVTSKKKTRVKVQEENIGNLGLERFMPQ